MKKYISLIFIILFILFLILLGNCSKAATCSLSTNKESVTVGDTITVTVKVNAAQWNLTLTADGKTIDTWTETVNYKENLSKTFTASYETTQKGTVTFKLTGDITDLDQTNTEKNETKTVTVKEQNTDTGSSGSGSGSSSSGSTGSGSEKPSGGTTTEKKPTFTSANKKVYTTGTVNLRASWSTSSNGVQVPKGTELTLTGTSTETINGYVWYRVTYNGATKYVASNLVTTTKPEEEKPDDEPNDEDKEKSNNNLSSLTIPGLTLTPEFSKDVLEYSATLEENKDKLDVEAKTEDSKATFEVVGADNLKDGENTIRIIVKAENGEAKAYTVKVTKKAGTTDVVDDGKLKLKSLEISGVDFDGGFDPEKYSYELTLRLAVKELNINAVANRENAKIEVVGNQNFVEGENLITIILTSEDGEETVTYQIKVNLTAGAVEKEKNIQFYLMCAGVGTAVILIIMTIIVIVKLRKKKKVATFDYIDLEEDEMPTSKMQDDEELLDDIDDTQKTRRSKGKHSI